ncbi:MAG: hypothetical protein Q8O52_25860 [Sulfuritalea sp.]|nr:hypothetical protein [Sulfuritalea sp.]
MTKKSDKTLLARDAKRDVGEELLQSVRDLKAGRWGRKTTIETLPDGSVRRRVELPSGKVAKDEVLTGARWALLSARSLHFQHQTNQPRITESRRWRYGANSARTIPRSRT